MPMLHKGVCTFLTQRGTPVPAPASAAFSLPVYLQNGKQDGECSSPAKGTRTEHKLCPLLAMKTGNINTWKTGNINIWKALKERPYPTLCVMKTGKYCHQAWLWKQSKLKRLTMEQKLSASRSSLQVCHETQKESFASLVLWNICVCGMPDGQSNPDGIKITPLLKCSHRSFLFFSLHCLGLLGYNIFLCCFF